MQRNTKKIHSKKKLLLFTIIGVFTIAALILGILFLPPALQYRSAKKYIESGNYLYAYQALWELGDYKDSKELLNHFVIHYTYSTEEEINYDENGWEIGHIWAESTYDQHGNMISKTSCDISGDVLEMYTADYFYDEQGNLTQQIHYDENGDIYWKCEHHYDQNGNQILYISYDREDTVITKNEFTFDSNGNLTCRLSTDAEGSMISKIEYAYDYSGNQVLKVVYNTDGSIRTQTEYLYDKSKHIIKQTHYDEEGFVYKEENTYNESGLLIQVCRYDADNTVTIQTEYTYNQDGKLQTTLVHNIIEGYRQKEEYEHHKDGSYRKLGYTTGSNGEFFLKNEFEYDQNENLTLQKTYTHDGKAQYTNEYVYNELGFLTKHVEQQHINFGGNTFTRTTNYSKFVISYSESIQ